MVTPEVMLKTWQKGACSVDLKTHNLLKRGKFPPFVVQRHLNPPFIPEGLEVMRAYHKKDSVVILLLELSLSEEHYLAKVCIGRGLKTLFQAMRESSCPVLCPTVDSSSLSISEDLVFLQEYHRSYSAAKLYSLTPKGEALADAFDKYMTEKKKQSSQ